MRKSHIAAAIILGVLSNNAHSASAGAGSSFDSRIQRIEYNPDDVIKVLIKKGTASVVQFAQGEKITGIGLGDPQAWNVSVINNFVFFRPQVDDNPDTNVAIVTDKRNYSFDLISTKKNPTYLLKFSYPKPAQKKPFEMNVKKIPCADGGYINGIYEVRGELSISPYQIWDDGRFTCLRWKNTKDLPIAYRTNSAGEEFLVNTHMDNNTMVIHEIAPSFVLRLGKSVLEFRTSTHVERRYNWRGTTTGSNLAEVDAYSSRSEISNPAAYARATPAPFTAAPASLTATPAAPASLTATPAAPASLTATPAAPASLTATPAAPASLTATPAAPASLTATPAAPASLAATPAAPASLAATPAAPASLAATPAAPASLTATPAAPASLAGTAATPAAVAAAVAAAASKSTPNPQFVTTKELWKAPENPAPAITATPKIEKPMSFNLTVKNGSSWDEAIEEWARSRGFSVVIRYYPDGEPVALNEAPSKPLYSGTDFYSAIINAEKAFKKENAGSDFHVSFDHDQKVAIIHPSNISVQAFKVKSGSLKDNAFRLTSSYGWKTEDEYWQAGDSFYVPAPWTFVTKKGDVKEAFDNLLFNFPVKANLLRSERTTYFAKD